MTFLEAWIGAVWVYAGVLFFLLHIFPMYVYIYIFTYMYMYLYIYLYMQLHMYMHMYIFVCICTCIQLYNHICWYPMKNSHDISNVCWLNHCFPRGAFLSHRATPSHHPFLIPSAFRRRLLWWLLHALGGQSGFEALDFLEKMGRNNPSIRGIIDLFADKWDFIIDFINFTVWDECIWYVKD